MWTNKTRLLTYTLLHTSQTTGALEPSEWRSLGTLSCTVLMWRFRWVFWVNFHEHWSHSNGLSPVWLLWWLCINKSNWVLLKLAFLYLRKFKDGGYMANNDYAIELFASLRTTAVTNLQAMHGVESFSAIWTAVFLVALLIFDRNITRQVLFTMLI